MILISDMDFGNLFGQCEQECAARRIVFVTQLCRHTPVQLADFRTSLERDGFRALIENGWLTKATNAPDGFYNVDDDFFRRCETRLTKVLP